MKPGLLPLCLLALLLAACTPPGGVRDSDQLDQPGSSPADLYVNLGVEYMREGQLEVALEKLKYALHMDPRNAAGHNAIAVLYERLGKTELASEHYHRALSLDASSPFIHNAYGAFLCTRKQFTEADAHFRQAAEYPLNRAPEVALTNAGSCALQVPDADRAETYFRSALQKNPEFAPALRQMVQISLDKQAYLSSRAYLQRYLAVAKHTAQTLWLGILTERKLGDQDAVASYELLLRADFPDSEQARQLEESKTR